MLTRFEQDYIAALVQLHYAKEPFRPSFANRKPWRAKKLDHKAGDMLPVLSINGMPIQTAIERMLGK